MLKFIEGDLFKSDCPYLVNPVNLKGVQGAGIAKAFRDWASPQYFKAYVEDCESGKLQIGKITTYSFTRVTDNNRRITIINFPTKIHWKDPSLLKYIRPGLDSLADLLYNGPDERSVAMPKLGCGFGGLNWPDVRSIIKEWYRGLEFNLDVEVYV